MKKFLVSLVFLLSACGGLISLDETPSPLPAPSAETPSEPAPSETAPEVPLPLEPVQDAATDATPLPEDAGVEASPVELPACGPNVMIACRGSSQGVPYCRMVSSPQDAGTLCSTPNESPSATPCEETFSYCQWRTGSACYLVTNLTEAECAARGGHL